MGFDTIIALMMDGADFEIGLEFFKGLFDIPLKIPL
jgi:hypothetical protein